MASEQNVEWLGEFVGHIREIHTGVLRRSGGSPGKHAEKLFASCARPFQSAFGEPAFATDKEKAGALFHGLITSHVFVDGNKRTASVATMFFLLAAGYSDEITSLQARILGELAVHTASSLLDADGVTEWLRRIFGGW